MRLINFGPGEIADRLSILALKITYGKDLGRSVAHFEQERAALLCKFNAPSHTGRWYEHAVELAAVNAVIWQDTDTVRKLRAALAKDDAMPIQIASDAALLAFRLQAMNDRRAELITFINETTGNNTGQEKI